MNLTAFQREDRGRRKFDVWRHLEKVSSVAGDVELEMTVDLDDQPDAEMLDAARELASFARDRGSELRSAIYSHYSEVCRRDPDWVVECGVPLGLTEHQVVDYVRSTSACVSRLHGEEEMERYFHVHPQWDEEHDLFLGLVGGSLAPLDE